jgi:hypothetical protein
MRHVRWARRIPAGRPIHIFGAGAGGLIVHDALRDAGVPVEGFVDDRVAGPVRDLPVRRLDAFAAGSGRTATVAIASRHWRTIARTLRAHAIADVVDASAIIWWSMPWPWFSGQRLGTLPALEAAMRAATGIGIEDLVGALGLSRAGNWGACAALLAAAGGDRDLPVFVEGTGAVAKDIRTFVNDLPGLHVVGHIEDGPPAASTFSTAAPGIRSSRTVPRTMPWSSSPGTAVAPSFPPCASSGSRGSWFGKTGASPRPWTSAVPGRRSPSIPR